jgi:hypothetical protein
MMMMSLQLSLMDNTNGGDKVIIRLAIDHVHLRVFLMNRLL